MMIDEEKPIVSVIPKWFNKRVVTTDSGVGKGL